jgi:hypothetical protein
MSEITLNCPQCHRLLRVTDELIGRPVKCPVCDANFSVAAGGQEPQAVTAATDAPPAPIPSSFPAGKYPDSAAEEDEGERPWEELGRRDAEPHRGSLVLTLGIVSVVMSTLAFCSAGLTGIVGFPLGVAAWVMGRRDLKKMRGGSMDREGDGLTQAGLICGIIGTVLGSVGLLCFLVYIGFAFTLPFRHNPPPRFVPPPAPAPIRPPPAPAPGLPAGNRAVLHDAP